MEVMTLGLNIPRASEKTIQMLIDCGVLYIGNDNQLHAIDLKENIPTPTTNQK